MFTLKSILVIWRWFSELAQPFSAICVDEWNIRLTECLIRWPSSNLPNRSSQISIMLNAVEAIASGHNFQHHWKYLGLNRDAPFMAICSDQAQSTFEILLFETDLFDKELWILQLSKLANDKETRTVNKVHAFSNIMTANSAQRHQGLHLSEYYRLWYLKTVDSR